MSELEKVLTQLSGKSHKRQRVDTIYNLNLSIVDALIAEIKRLNKSGNTETASNLITIAEAVLQSNNSYKELIEELMRQAGE